MSYALIGKRVRVHLYNVHGELLYSITGRVADFSSQMPIRDTFKDLVYVVGIEGPSDDKYINSAGQESEGWFATSDVEVIEDTEGPITRLNFN